MRPHNFKTLNRRPPRLGISEEMKRDDPTVWLAAVQDHACTVGKGSGDGTGDH